MPRRFEPQPVLGRVVRERRNALGLSQEVVATRADMAKMHLSKIENGSGNPSFGTLKRLAGALETTVAALSDRTTALEAEDEPR